LNHADLSKPFVLKTDTFNFVVSVVLFQVGEDNLFHYVDFCSCKFSLMEINYEIHDKETLAIMVAFEEWHHLLEGTQHEITMYPNHKNL
jgi:hypothetical protein